MSNRKHALTSSNSVILEFCVSSSLLHHAIVTQFAYIIAGFFVWRGHFPYSIIDLS